LFSIFFDIRTTVVLISLYGLPIQGTKIRYFYRNINWQTVIWYAAPGFPASIVGGWLLFVVPAQVVQICVSSVCILYVLMRATKYCPKVKASRKNTFIFGSLNGVIGGVIGNSAILRNPILLSMGFTKEAFIGTSAMIAILTLTGKITAYAFNFEWTKDMFVIVAITLPAILLGMKTGRYLLKHVTPKLFERMLLSIILIGAVRLMYTAF